MVLDNSVNNDERKVNEDQKGVSFLDFYKKLEHTYDKNVAKTLGIL